MNISPVYFRFSNVSVKNDSSNKSHFSSSMPSFGARIAFPREMGEINAIIKKDIKPFVNEAAPLMTELAKIYERYREKAELFARQDFDFTLKKINLTNLEKHPKLSQYVPIIEASDRIHHQMKDYEKLLLQGLNENWTNAEISSKIKEVKRLLYTYPAEISSIKPLVVKFKSKCFELARQIEELTLQNVDKALYTKKVKSQNLRDKALFYFMMSPYDDAVKFLKDFAQFTEEMKKPLTELHRPSKMVDYYRGAADTIVQRKCNYYNNLYDIRNFVEQNKGQGMQSVTEQTVKESYQRLLGMIEARVNRIVSALDIYCMENYSLHNTKPDLDGAVKLVEKRQKALDELSAMIKEAKENYFAKQNDDFLKKYGN